MLGQILLTPSWSLYQIAPKCVLSVKQGSAERICRVFLYSESLLPSWVFLYLGIHLFVCKIKALLFFKVFPVCFSGCREKLKYDSSRISKWKIGAFRWEMQQCLQHFCHAIPDKLVGVLALCKKPCTVPAGICCVFQWQLTRGGIDSISVFWGNNEK